MKNISIKAISLMIVESATLFVGCSDDNTVFNGPDPGPRATDLNIPQKMKRFIYSLLFVVLSISAIQAENVNVVIPTSKSGNYALYPADTGVFLRLDTRNGTMQAIVPSNTKKNRVLNSHPLVSDDKPERFELYPTENSWEWILFDSTTGEVWLLRWSAKNDILTKINTEI